MGCAFTGIDCVKVSEAFLGALLSLGSPSACYSFANGGSNRSGNRRKPSCLSWPGAERKLSKLGMRKKKEPQR